MRARSSYANNRLKLRCQAHVKLLEVVDSVTLEEVNAIGASVLSYISHYKNEAALLEEVGPDYIENGYARPGPTRMTSIVACVPAFMDASGQSTGDKSEYLCASPCQHACCSQTWSTTL